MGKCINKLRLIGFEKLIKTIEEIAKFIDIGAEDFCEKQIVRNIKLFDSDDKQNMALALQQSIALALLMWNYIIDNEDNTNLIVLKSSIVSKELLGTGTSNDNYIFNMLLLRDKNYTKEENIRSIVKLNSYKSKFTPITLCIERICDKGFYGLRVVDGRLVDSKGKSHYIGNKHNMVLSVSNSEVALFDRVDDRRVWRLDVEEKIKDIIRVQKEVYDAVSCGSSELWKLFVFWGDNMSTDEYIKWIKELKDKQ